MRFIDEELMENLTEEEIDDLYRPRKTNGRKSFAPLYIYLILKEQTNNDIHFTQQDVINALREEPYSINLERKAVGRILNQLGDFDMDVVTSTKYGFWYNQSA